MTSMVTRTAERAITGALSTGRKVLRSAVTEIGERRARSAPPPSAAITVAAPADRLRELLTDPHALSMMLTGIATVSGTEHGRTRWHLPAPADVALDMRIAEELPGELLRWQSPELELEFRFRPAPADHGTEVLLRTHAAPRSGGTPAGPLARPALAVAARQLLRGMKSLAETGEIPTLKRNPSARTDAAVSE